MAPTNGIPIYKRQFSWAHKRSWVIRYCKLSSTIIWPWHMAWREADDKLYGGSIYSTIFRWVSEDAYLVMKLKGEV